MKHALIRHTLIRHTLIRHTLIRHAHIALLSLGPKRLEFFRSLPVKEVRNIFWRGIIVTIRASHGTQREREAAIETCE